MNSECRLCYAEIPSSKTLCDDCTNDILEKQRQAGEAERVFRERQARAAGVE